MHDGCSGSFETGKEVADKVRMMGFDRQPMPIPMTIDCTNCGETFQMETFADKCKCGMVYAVTPCHAFDPANVMAAGIDY
jgi:hypothetical protein